MDDKRIQQVLEIEEQARDIKRSALVEAEQIKIEAEKQAEGIIESSRTEAEEEASRMISSAGGEEEAARILDESEQSASNIKARARNNFDRAVSYVMNRLVHRE